MWWFWCWSRHQRLVALLPERTSIPASGRWKSEWRRHLAISVTRYMVQVFWFFQANQSSHWLKHHKWRQRNKWGVVRGAFGYWGHALEVDYRIQGTSSLPWAPWPWGEKLCLVCSKCSIIIRCLSTSLKAKSWASSVVGHHQSWVRTSKAVNQNFLSINWLSLVYLL